MRDDILFHLTTRDDWKADQAEGNYEPESLETEGFIPCSSGHQIEETANRLFAGKQKILLLVIDVSSLHPQVKYEEDSESGDKFPHIYGPINTNAIIDKIDIHAEDDGKFKISFNSYT
jgi:uncharacterized protein (DUF952 family)